VCTSRCDCVEATGRVRDGEARIGLIGWEGNFCTCFICQTGLSLAVPENRTRERRIGMIKHTRGVGGGGWGVGVEVTSEMPGLCRNCRCRKLQNIVGSNNEGR
jgi:hypothetical protein